MVVEPTIKLAADVGVVGRAIGALTTTMLLPVVPKVPSIVERVMPVFEKVRLAAGCEMPGLTSTIAEAVEPKTAEMVDRRIPALCTPEVADVTPDEKLAVVS